MPPRPSFEEMVLTARDKERKTYGNALADLRGPMPGSRYRSEDDQDELWAHVDPQYADPHAFMLLMLPPQYGGQGLTPLAASYTKYPNRQMLVEGAGADIESQIKYAEKRRKRMLEKGLPETPPVNAGSSVMPVPSVPMTAPAMPVPAGGTAPVGAPAPQPSPPVMPPMPGQGG